MTPSPAAGEEGEAAGPEEFGAWRVLEVLGEGASGRVLLARRGDLDDGRRVAIKTLHSPSRAGLARFELERQALARLEHPNIARLYDAGISAAGAPFVVLEHVDGLPIDDYCEQHGLDLEERLRLFLEVCRGVQHAHRNLIVHRDLKPANILVDAEGRPRLLDFGIARLLDSAPAAAPHPAHESGPDAPTELAPAPTTLLADAVARTPAYASPEQILGKPITTASDVFSLGIVLYELLAGRSPWAGRGSRHELERAICEEDAEPLGRAARKLHPEWAGRLAGALDAVLHKALAREPADRYASVEALARDLENHLEHRPVTARPPSVLTTGRLFLRRHLGAVLTAAALFLAIVAFVLVLAGRQRVLRAERDKAERTLAFLVEVFRAGEPGQAGAGERADQISARQIVDRAARRVQDELRDQPDSQATLLGAIGEVYYSLGLYEEAVRMHELALERWLALYGDDNLETAATRSHLADALVMGRGGPERAEQMYRRAVAVRRAKLGKDAPEVINDLIGLATSLQGQKENRMEEEIALRREIVELTPHREVAHRLLVLGTLATALLSGRRYAEAAKVNDEAYELARISPDESTVDFADGLFEVGVALSNDLDPRFREVFARSLAIRRKLLPADHPRLLESEQSWARILMDDERFAEALPILEHVVEAKVRILGHDHMLTPRAEIRLAHCIGELGDWDRAVSLGEAVVERAEKAGRPPAELWILLSYLSAFERSRGHLDAAWNHLMRAEKCVLEPGMPRAYLVEVQLRHAALEADMGRLQAALERFAVLIPEMREVLPADDWKLDWADAEQARVLALAGRPAEALPLAVHAYDDLSANFGSRSKNLRQPLAALVAIHRATGDDAARAQAEKWLADAGSRPARLAATGAAAGTGK